MKIGPKFKICKRLGSAVFEKCQTQKFAVSEARSAKRGGRRRRLSNYGQQLLEKQKARYTYGMSERQFARYVKNSLAGKGENPAQQLFEKLESRLDNVVFRLGLATTRRMARQLVSHGHILVNGTKSTFPSHNLQVGDKISVRRKDKTVFKNMEDFFKSYNQPNWLNFDQKKLEGEVIGMPTYDTTENLFDLTTVIEFYSR